MRSIVVVAWSFCTVGFSIPSPHCTVFEGFFGYKWTKSCAFGYKTFLPSSNTAVGCQHSNPPSFKCCYQRIPNNTWTSLVVAFSPCKELPLLLLGGKRKQSQRGAQIGRSLIESRGTASTKCRASNAFAGGVQGEGRHHSLRQGEGESVPFPSSPLISTCRFFTLELEFQS